MFGRTRRQRDDDRIEDESTSSPEDEITRDTGGPQRRRRWPYVLLAFVLFLALLPNIIGWTGLHQTAIDYATSRFDGSIEVDGMRTGWLQTTELTGVTIKDANDEIVLQAGSIQTSKHLLQFLTGQDLGIIDVFQPHLNLHLRNQGSNLEDVIASLATFSSSEEPVADPAAPVKLPTTQVNLHNGTALVTGEGLTTQWHLDQLAGSVQTGSSEAALLFQLGTQVTTDQLDAQGNRQRETPGTVSVIGQVDEGQAALSLAGAVIAVETDQLPLSPLTPALRRILGPSATKGRLSGKFQLFYNGQGQSIAIKLDQVDGQELMLACPSLIGEDLIRVESLSLAGDVQLTPNLILAREFSANSDLGKVNANGDFDLHQISQLTQQGRLLDSPFQMDGTIELARVVQMLPSTLQLHQGLEVTSGTVSFQVNGKSEPALEGTAKRLVVNVDTANLRATRNGKEIVWSKPIRIVGTIADNAGELAIEQFECVSDFLNLKGQGTMQSASFEASGNLGTLKERLGQFVDFSEIQFDGEVDGKFGWRIVDGHTPDPNDPFQDLPLQIGGTFFVKQPLFQTPDIPQWKPEELAVKFSATGKTKRRLIDASNENDVPPGYALRLDQAGLQVDLGQERAIIALNQPVDDTFLNERWLADCQLTGDLNRWMGHLRNFVDYGEIQGQGAVNIVSTIDLTGNRANFSATRYQATDFGFQGYGMTIGEPSVEGDATGHFNFDDGKLTFTDLTLVANSVSARARNFVVAYPSNLRLDGEVAYRGNVNRIADWFELQSDTDSIHWFGGAEGTLKLSSDQNGITIESDSTINDLIAASQSPVVGNQPTGPIVEASNPLRQWNSLWQEPKLTLLGGITVGADFDSLRLDQAQIKSNGLSASVNGTVNDLYSRMVLDVDGQWQPDWTQIGAIVQQYAGDALAFEGSQAQPFSIQGPLFSLPKSENSIVAQPTAWLPQEVAAATKFGWQRGQVLGLPVGATEFDIRVDQGLAKVSTKGIPFAGGNIQFAPLIDLRGSEPIMKMDWTRLVDNVELTPDTTRQWLRYVAPLLADATSAQGNFTVDIGEASIPLMQPKQMEARGSVKLSNVLIGAGPVAQQLIGTVKQVRQLLKPEASERDLNTWVQMSEQLVPIVIRDGRVYHDKVDFTHKDLTIRTRGSVSFDQDLQLVAEIPIADDWIDGKDYLVGLKGQSISIPITGKVSNPKLDKSAIDRLSRNLVKTAATGAVNNAVKEKLTPKLNEFQQKFNDKINGQFNKFQSDLNKKLGIEPGKNGGSLLPSPGQLLPGLLPGGKK